MRLIRAIAAVAAGGALCLAPAPAWAYVESPAGTFTVTNAEVQAAFGTGVDLAKVGFEVESSFTWYAVPCKKEVGKGKKTLTKVYNRQTHMTAAETLTRTATGFTVVVTGWESQSNVKCPGGFKANGTPTVIGQSPVTHLLATYNGIAVELART